MPTDSVLLDTTVQLWRIVYGPDETEHFARELVDKTEVYTTSLVFREFVRTIIGDVEYLHLQTSECLKPDADGRIGLGRLCLFLGAARNYSSRSVKRLHLVIGKLLDGFSATKVPRSKILVRLERTANRWMRDFFRYLDSSGEHRQLTCLTALDDTGYLEQMRRARPFPPRPVFPSKAASFLDERREQVERAEAAMGKATCAEGRDKKLLNFLDRLKGKDGGFDFLGRLPMYKEHCWRLGDLLIVLESPEGAAIYSTDRAFAVLTRALDKRLYRGYLPRPAQANRANHS